MFKYTAATLFTLLLLAAFALAVTQTSAAVPDGLGARRPTPRPYATIIRITPTPEPAPRAFSWSGGLVLSWDMIVKPGFVSSKRR